MDVTDEAQVASGVNRPTAAFGGLDIVVSNAGIQHIAPIHELAYADWRRVVRIHLDAAFLVTRAALQHMYARHKGGSIIYMGSVHSKEASPLKAPYVAAKHGLLGLARTVAKEGAQFGVRSNVVCPGFVRTPLVERQIPEQAAALGISEADVIQERDAQGNRRRRVHHDGRRSRDNRILSSFPSNALTGQSIVVSHGWNME